MFSNILARWTVKFSNEFQQNMCNNKTCSIKVMETGSKMSDMSVWLYYQFASRLHPSKFVLGKTTPWQAHKKQCHCYFTPCPYVCLTGGNLYATVCLRCINQEGVLAFFRSHMHHGCEKTWKRILLACCEKTRFKQLKPPMIGNVFSILGFVAVLVSAQIAILVSFVFSHCSYNDRGIRNCHLLVGCFLGCFLVMVLTLHLAHCHPCGVRTASHVKLLVWISMWIHLPVLHAKVTSINPGFRKENKHANHKYVCWCINHHILRFAPVLRIPKYFDT